MAFPVILLSARDKNLIVLLFSTNDPNDFKSASYNLKFVSDNFFKQLLFDNNSTIFSTPVYPNLLPDISNSYSNIKTINYF